MLDADESLENQNVARNVDSKPCAQEVTTGNNVHVINLARGHVCYI